MYSIANVIYGIPLNANKTEDQIGWSADLEEAIESEYQGFLTYYSGIGDWIPAAFGIKLCEFDAACDHVDIYDLKLKPTEAQLLQFNTNWNALTTKMRSEVVKHGQPHVFIQWSSS